MAMEASSKSFLEKERRTDWPGAKLGIDATHNASRPDYQGLNASSSLGKNHGSLTHGSGGTFAASSGRSVPGENRKNTSEEVLPPIGRNDLIREWQCMILPFPLKQSAEEQDATTKAVESQRNGDSAVSFLGAVNQARANPRVRAQIARLIGIPGHYGDPDFMEAWDAFMSFMTRKQQMAEDGPAVACDEAMGDLFGGVH